MKKIIVLVMALCLSCSAMAKGAACPKGQWLNGKKCAACPTGGICDGNIMKCNTGNRWVQSGSKCVCQGYWKYKSGKDPNHCYACPKNATCNGGNGAAGIKCNAGYKLSGEQCVADKNAKATNTKSAPAATNKGLTCPKGQWMNGTKCAACPTGASCDGKVFKCGKNMTMVKNVCVCAGYIAGNGKCYECPKGAVCSSTKSSYKIYGIKCGAGLALKGKFDNGTLSCVACPKNATCKDGVIRYNPGYCPRKNLNPGSGFDCGYPLTCGCL